MSCATIKESLHYVATLAHYGKQIVFEMLTAVRVVAQIDRNASE